jgi:hypothetical protein
VSIRRTPDGGLFLRAHRLCLYVRAHRAGLVLTWTDMEAAVPCLRARARGWGGVLRECKYPAGHRGPHRTAALSVQWAGRLTDEELDRAEELRHRV